MKRASKTIIAIVVVIIVAGGAYGAFAYYSLFIESNGGNSCIPYLRTDCGGNHNAISYNTSTGDITIPSVSQSYGSTWYNVAVAYVPGNPNFEPTKAFFQADTADFSGNTLNSGQTVTIHNLNATGPGHRGPELQRESLDSLHVHQRRLSLLGGLQHRLGMPVLPDRHDYAQGLAISHLMSKRP